MPRNACTECRLGKVKCTALGEGRKCERCNIRNLPCSYTRSHGSPNDSGFSSSLTPENRDPRYYSQGFLPRVESQAPVYTLTNNQSGLDIGTGTPSEILREGELTQSLLLLYFSNFSDIHFMFDQDLFLRQFALGESPKILLYAMMALGIKYSQAPFYDHLSRSHRGEPLFWQARQLLQEDFDHPSLTTIQAYVLLSTYLLTFGGARKAWMYLSDACSILKILRLMDESWEVDPLQKELTRRLVCTVALMDRMISPSLNVQCNFQLDDPIPVPCGEEELQNLKNRTFARTNDTRSRNVVAELVHLSSLFCQVCVYHRSNNAPEKLLEIETQLSIWSNSLPDFLQYTRANLESHHQRQSLRQFAYMHLIYHHICQLTLFRSLTANRPQEEINEQAANCHSHACRIIDIIQYTWEHAGFDLHNASVGQILTVAAVIHTHALLTTSSIEIMEASKTRITMIRDYFGRAKKHCRLFDWVSAQLESFLRLCSQTRTSTNLFDKNEGLIRQMLHYGTYYERLNYQNAGRLRGLEALAGQDVQHNQPFQQDGSNNNNNNNNSSGGGGGGHRNSEFSSDDYLSWLANGRESGNQAFENCAWVFSDASLLDLYSMSYV